jgi:hypothetical protein
MSESIPSPFYTDRGIGQAAASLAQAFLPNPLREARMQGIAANAELDRARAGEIARRGAAGEAAGARLRAGSVDPGTLANVFADILAGANPEMMQALPGFIRGFGGAAGADPGRLAQLFVGAGGNYGHTEPGFRYNVDTDAATARRGQDVSAGAQRYAVDQQQAGADRRMVVEVNPGNTAYVAPGSPMAPRAGSNGQIVGAPTRDTVAGENMRRYGAGEGTPEERARWRETFAPSSANRPPMDINGPDTRAIDEQIGASMPPGSALSPEAAQVVRARTAELYQQSRNMVAAAQQAVREFMAQNPPRTDSSWNPLSARTFGVPTPAAPAAGAPQRSAGPSNLPPAPTEGAPPAAGFRARNGTVVPEGATIRQNGRTFIIRNGVPVPAS